VAISDKYNRLENTSSVVKSEKLVSIPRFDFAWLSTYEHVTETILEDEKYKVLREFTSIYGIGPITAHMLFAHKCRTLEDVKRFYENSDNTSQPAAEDDDDDDDDENENEYEDKNRHVPEKWIEVSLALKDDLSIK
jgi:hypothetical protein